MNYPQMNPNKLGVCIKFLENLPAKYAKERENKLKTT